MSATISIRCRNAEQKKFINDNLADLVDDRGELVKKVDAIQFILDQYLTEYKALRYREAPESVEALIRENDCQYLKYEPFKEGKEENIQFVCYEFFSRKKKPSPLGSDHELILGKCDLCKAGKIDRIELEVQKQLRKKNIKGLLDLRDILINLQIEGGLAQIYICKANLMEKKTLILCTNGTHLTCPLFENQEVQVKNHCYNQITPWTQEPPCQYLIDPHIMVQIAPGEEAEQIIEAIALEYEAQEPQPIKEADAEQVEPEGEEET